ncbi:protein HUA2-LIKE 1 [Triticum aestivum]|nr:protein HUA2-LIKE 1-like [Triticum aestivum]
MMKAYDRVEWNYLEAIMTKMGFAPSWVASVMRMVTSVKFSVLFNGAEGLSCLFKTQPESSHLTGIQVAPTAPPVQMILGGKTPRSIQNTRSRGLGSSCGSGSFAFPSPVRVTPSPRPTPTGFNGVRADAGEEGLLGPRRRMDPAAKRVAPGSKWTRDPQLGDLVLAKVKGYPYWPAKVCRPEDWKLQPSPRKFFVVFFGAKDIAHVALQYLLPFTEEVKSDLVNQAREKRFPVRHAKGLEEALVEILEAYDELAKSSEIANGLLPDQSLDPVGKPTEPLVKTRDGGGTPKLEQLPKSSESANGLLPDPTLGLIEKPTESLVKTRDDGGTPKLAQLPKSSETANVLFPDQIPDPIEKHTEPLVKRPADGGTLKLEQTDDFQKRYSSLNRRKKRVPFAAIEERNLEDPYGIPKCIAALEGLPELQMEDILKAADLFMDNKGNREVFLSFSSSALRLGWLRRKIHNTSEMAG